MQAVGIVGAIGEHLATGKSGNKTTRRHHVVLLARADGEADQRAKHIDYGMQLGAEAAA